jgi:hypothetical protein
MADKQVKELNEQTTLDDSDLILLQDGATDETKKVTADTVKNTVLSGSDSIQLGYVEVLTGQNTTSTSYVDVSSTTITFTTPPLCTRIFLRAELSVSSDTASGTIDVAITDSANNIQVERSDIASASSAAEIRTLSLSRRVTVTPSTAYTFKLRFHVSGGTGVINQGDVATRPTILWAERAT